MPTRDVLRLESGTAVPSLLAIGRIAGVLGVEVSELVAAGYSTAEVPPENEPDLVRLVEQLSEPQKVIAHKLLSMLLSRSATGLPEDGHLITVRSSSC